MQLRIQFEVKDKSKNVYSMKIKNKWLKQMLIKI